MCLRIDIEMLHLRHAVGAFERQPSLVGQKGS